MKKNSTYIFLCIAGFLLFLGCEGPAGPSGVQGIAGKDGGYDKQIRLNFPSGVGTQDTAGFVPLDQWYQIVKFNKSYYTNVDSVIFLAYLRTSDTSAACRLELFNITDNIKVDSSLIQSKDTTYKLVGSKNIMAYLPSKEITLSLKISCTKQGTPVEAVQPAVYLYRR